MEITLEEIQKKFESLPEDLKWAIMAAKVDENIIEIGNMQGLNVEQMGQLSLETHMEMFGFTHPDKFEESVKNSLKLSDEKIHSIVNAINEKILKEIRAKMMKQSDGAPTVEKTSPEEKTDTEILTSAGIKIVPEKLELSSPLLIDKEGENTSPILTRKLSDYVKNEVVKTEHSLNNLSKMGSQNEAPIPQAPKTIPTSYPPNGDPYRLPPD